jgi:hypothetical protein
MEVFDYIRQYCGNRGINRYDVRSKVLVKRDFALPHTFAPGIAFFYRFCATGTINNIADITERVLDISTSNEFFDMSQIVNIKDFMTVQQANADFIFVSDNMLKTDLKEGANALFSNIYSAQLFYYYVTILDSTRNASPAADARPRTDVFVQVDNIKA